MKQCLVIKDGVVVHGWVDTFGDPKMPQPREVLRATVLTNHGSYLWLDVGYCYAELHKDGVSGDTDEERVRRLAELQRGATVYVVVSERAINGRQNAQVRELPPAVLERWRNPTSKAEKS